MPEMVMFTVDSLMTLEWKKVKWPNKVKVEEQIRPNIPIGFAIYSKISHHKLLPISYLLLVPI